MGVFKKILKSDATRAAACWAVSHYVRLVRLTSRWETIGGDIPARFWDENKPFILAFWHGRILMMPVCWRRSATLYMMASQHRDGQMIAGMVSHFGVRSIMGSTSKGGAAALRGQLKRLKEGNCVGITPDGPRGPRMRAQGGVVALAKLSGIPIIPATVSISSPRVLGSWDSFLVAKPFSKGVCIWGDPIEVARDADDESARRQVEDTLNALTRQADERTGIPPIEPAPADPEQEPSA